MMGFSWKRGALALALALGLGGFQHGLAQGDEDGEMDFEAPATATLGIRSLDIQLSAADDVDYPGAFLVAFEVTGGPDLNTATGFLIEDASSGAVVFHDGYLDATEDEGVLLGMAAWGVGDGDCGTTRNLRVVVVSEEFGEGDDVQVTRLVESAGSIEVTAAYCKENGIGSDL